MKTEVTPERKETILDNKDKEIDELSDMTGLDNPIIELIIRVDEDEGLQSRTRDSAPREALEIRESDELYNSDQLADEVDVSLTKIRWDLDKGILPDRRKNRFLYFTEEDVENYKEHLHNPIEDPDSKWVGTEEATQYIDLAQGTIRNHCSQGELPCKKFNGRWGVNVDKLEDD